MIFMQGGSKVLSTTIIILLCIIVITVTRQNFFLQEENSNTRALEREQLMSSQQRLELSQPRQSNMVGGYSNLGGGGDKSLLKSEQVAIVANFALNEHAAKTSSAEGDSTNESLLSVSPDDVESGKVVAVVLEAQRQVVAGLNYKLTIALIKDSICLGALKVIVYDHFGELSVTKWGDQLTCLDVQDLLDEVQVEKETAIEVEERIEEEVETAKPNERRG